MSDISRRRWHFNPILRRPDMHIGGEDQPYIRRWYVLSTPWFRVYLHNMLRDDDDRALHDHPWSNVSIIVKGGFVEVMPAYATDRIAFAPIIRILRRPGSVIIRRATDAHRLELPKGVTSSWSIFLTGSYQRKWGFHCPQGWRPYEQFVKPNAPGEIGRGCAP